MFFYFSIFGARSWTVGRKHDKEQLVTGNHDFRI